ncbi:retinoic acid receptor responder protein 2 [Myotis yumanensis]|uniref:retinoic acid receptor responder protein 2 n=1 Tax=Myotis yumanensis TaxID=159337 RepID=UPI0038D1DB71
MWQLLILLALWLGTVGLGRAELTEAQHQGLQVALEEFHKHPRVQWAFQKTSVDNAMDKPSQGGTFVRLEFTLQQTGCGKKDWKRTECKAKPNGRKRKCLACIKLNPEFKVLDRMVHCPIEMQTRQGPKEHQEAQCSRIEQAQEGAHRYYFPGQFAFLQHPASG